MFTVVEGERCWPSPLVPSTNTPAYVTQSILLWLPPPSFGNFHHATRLCTTLAPNPSFNHRLRKLGSYTMQYAPIKLV